MTAVSDPAGNGQYEVTFNRSLVNCVVQAAVGFGNPRAGGNAFPASIPFVNIAGGAPDGEVSVSFRDADLTTSVVDTSFLITAFY